MSMHEGLFMVLGVKRLVMTCIQHSHGVNKDIGWEIPGAIICVLVVRLPNEGEIKISYFPEGYTEQEIFLFKFAWK